MKILGKIMDPTITFDLSKFDRKSLSFEFQSEMSNIIILVVKKCAPKVRSC